MNIRYVAACFGLSAVALFALSLLVFSALHPDFHILEDYVSELGALGQPYALWWNLIGFLGVGLLLATFGYIYGRSIDDRLVGILLTVFGLGFATTAFPIDTTEAASPVSKVHVVAICLGLAAWLLALARMAHLPSLGKYVHVSANIAAALLFFPILGQGLQLWSMPVTHRLVFVVVFGWLAVTSFRLLIYGRGQQRRDGYG